MRNCSRSWVCWRGTGTLSGRLANVVDDAYIYGASRVLRVHVERFAIDLRPFRTRRGLGMAHFGCRLIFGRFWSTAWTMGVLTKFLIVMFVAATSVCLAAATVVGNVTLLTDVSQMGPSPYTAEFSSQARTFEYISQGLVLHEGSAATTVITSAQ